MEDISDFFSYGDRRRLVKLPNGLTVELAELTGIIIGDGYLYSNGRKYIVGIVGDPSKDYNYFNDINKLFYAVFNIRASLNVRGRGLRLIINSKVIYHYFTKILNLEHGYGKGKLVVIPTCFMKDQKLILFVLRGIFDSDGTVFTSNKMGSPNYPSIELTTTSLRLAEQVKNILVGNGFRVAGVRKYDYKGRNVLTSYKVGLYGINNMQHYEKMIGFSNHCKKARLMEIVKKVGLDAPNGTSGI